MNIQKKLPSRVDVIPQFIKEVIDKLNREIHPHDDDLFQIKLVLEESLTNAIRHGNKLNPDLSVNVSVTTRNNRLIMQVKDEGEGFDFDNVPDPTTEEKLLLTSGRGVFLIKKLMDEVNFDDSGREITMIKILKKK